MRFTFSKLAGALSPLPILLVCASGVATAQGPSVITASELAGSRAEIPTRQSVISGPNCFVPGSLAR